MKNIAKHILKKNNKTMYLYINADSHYNYTSVIIYINYNNNNTYI